VVVAARLAQAGQRQAVDTETGTHWKQGPAAKRCPRGVSCASAAARTTRFNIFTVPHPQREGLPRTGYLRHTNARVAGCLAPGRSRGRRSRVSVRCPLALAPDGSTLSRALFCQSRADVLYPVSGILRHVFDSQRRRMKVWPLPESSAAVAITVEVPPAVCDGSTARAYPRQDDTAIGMPLYAPQRAI
jgi:hypothetical protein